jgi:hypothetical protein
MAGKPAPDFSVDQDQGQNFRDKGKLYLVRCYCCGGETGRENWAPYVASGVCAWCGWRE